jgi:acetyltransferase
MAEEGIGKEPEFQTVTKDGRPIRIRALRPEDGGLVEELFKSLSPRSIFFRFLTHWKSVPPEIIAYFKNTDCDLNVAVAALDMSSPDERMLGLCGILHKPGSEKGELAVVVRDAWQGIGIGAKLVEASLPRARERGMKELWGIISPENRTMIAMAGKMGFALHRDRESDVYEMKMQFPISSDPPDLQEVHHEGCRKG